MNLKNDLPVAKGARPQIKKILLDNILILLQSLPGNVFKMLKDQRCPFRHGIILL